MARLRTVKPGLFTNDLLAEIAPLGRLLFIGLWCIADREGRLEDRPRRIKAEVLPYDEADVDTLLNDLHARNFIIRYEADGNRYIQVVNWQQWQPFEREIPPEWESLRQTVFNRDNYICAYCGEHIDNPDCDHVIPVSRGGSNDIGNLVTACKRCNQSKGDKTPEEWLQ